MNENTLNTTFSAVAQTLAAVLAILISIVVIRLPTLEADIARANLILRVSPAFKDDYIRARDALLKDGLDGLKKEKFAFDLSDVNVGGILDAGHRASKARLSLIPAIWSALAPTFFVIAACLVALPGVPSLTTRPGLAKALVLVVLVLGIICLLSYGALMARLIGGQ